MTEPSWNMFYFYSLCSIGVLVSRKIETFWVLDSNHLWSGIDQPVVWHWADFFHFGRQKQTCRRHQKRITRWQSILQVKSSKINWKIVWPHDPTNLTIVQCGGQRCKKYFSFCHPGIIVQYFLLLSRNFKLGLCIYILRNLISFVLFEIYYSKNVKIVLIFYIFVGL